MDAAQTSIASAPAMPEIEYKGKKYPYTPMDPEELIAAAEAELRRTKTPDMAAVIKQYDALADRPELQKELMDRAYRDLAPHNKSIGQADLQEFINSLDGVVWLVWRHLIQSDPTATRELAREILVNEGVKARKIKGEVAAKARVVAAGLPAESAPASAEAPAA